VSGTDEPAAGAAAPTTHESRRPENEHWPTVWTSSTRSVRWTEHA
jgi:hypothetical protein